MKPAVGLLVDHSTKICSESSATAALELKLQEVKQSVDRVTSEQVCSLLLLKLGSSKHKSTLTHLPNCKEKGRS